MTAALDLSKIKVSNSSEPLPASTRGRTAGPNPMETHVKLSKDQEKVKQITDLPVAQVKEVVSLLRRAASTLDVGLSISYPHTVEDYKSKSKDEKGNTVEKDSTRWKATPDSNGNVTIRFEAKAKRVKAVKTTPATTETTPATAETTLTA